MIILLILGIALFGSAALTLMFELDRKAGNESIMQ